MVSNQFREDLHLCLVQVFPCTRSMQWEGDKTFYTVWEAIPPRLEDSGSSLISICKSVSKHCGIIKNAESQTFH